jgi:cytochrome c5
MRHVLANLFLYVLVALLALGSVVFARIREAQLLISDEPTVASRYDETLASAFDWRALGERKYAANCQRCHGAGGRGWDQYPGLVGMDAMLVAPGGRDYLIALHLWGLASDRWRAPMPPMSHMPDPDLAAAIGHALTHFGNRIPPGVPWISPAEIAAHRDRPLSPHEVGRLRPTPAREARR